MRQPGVAAAIYEGRRQQARLHRYDDGRAVDADETEGAAGCGIESDGESGCDIPMDSLVRMAPEVRRGAIPDTADPLQGATDRTSALVARCAVVVHVHEVATAAGVVYRARRLPGGRRWTPCQQLL